MYCIIQNTLLLYSYVVLLSSDCKTEFIISGNCHEIINKAKTWCSKDSVVWLKPQILYNHNI